MPSFATSQDFAECVRLHRQYGTTYYFSSRFFPRESRRRVDALYGFVRVADEWVDNPGAHTIDQSRHLLNCFRHELLDGISGVVPSHPVMRAFLTAMSEVGMPDDEPIRFLNAMDQDLRQTQYESFEDLCGYMRGSAAAVGLMMLRLLNLPGNPEQERAAIALGNAMQLTNFLRDIGEDLVRGRVYVPQEDLLRFGVSLDDLHEARVTPQFRELMKFEIARARALYSESDSEIAKLPISARRAVKSARILYSKILDRIELQDYDVFRRRARTSRATKLAVAARLLVWP